MRVIGPQDLQVISAPPQALLERFSCAYELTVRIAGIAMQMRFDDAAVRDKFAYRYRHHLCDEAAAIAYACAVYQGSHYFWSDRAAWCWPNETLPLEAIVLFADATAMSTLVRSDPGLISFHAAAVGYGGAVAALIGDSTAGKTTTAVACARRGMQIYSDERLLMRHGTLVLPFLRAFNIRQHGAMLLGADGIADALGERLAAPAVHGDWADLSPFEYLPHLRVPKPRPLRAIFLLDGKAEQIKIAELDSLRASPRLLASIDCMAHARIDRAARVIALLRRLRVFSLTLGRPDATAAAIKSILQELGEDAA